MTNHKIWINQIKLNMSVEKDHLFMHKNKRGRKLCSYIGIKLMSYGEYHGKWLSRKHWDTTVVQQKINSVLHNCSYLIFKAFVCVCVYHAYLSRKSLC